MAGPTDAELGALLGKPKGKPGGAPLPPLEGDVEADPLAEEEDGGGVAATQDYLDAQASGDAGATWAAFKAMVAIANNQ